MIMPKRTMMRLPDNKRFSNFVEHSLDYIFSIDKDTEPKIHLNEDDISYRTTQRIYPNGYKNNVRMVDCLILTHDPTGITYTIEPCCMSVYQATRFAVVELQRLVEDHYKKKDKKVTEEPKEKSVFNGVRKLFGMK